MFQFLRLMNTVSFESVLINKVKSGDKSAYKQLYLNYSNMMYIFICRKINDEEEAKDLVQELFIRIWNTKDRLKVEESFKAYIYKIAGNLVIDYLRKKSTLDKYIVKDNDIEGVIFPAEGFDVQERINEEINQLPEMQKMVFCLSRYENLKYAEISKMYQISPKTVENHAGRALKRLREKLSDLIISIIIFNLLNRWS